MKHNSTNLNEQQMQSTEEHIAKHETIVSEKRKKRKKVLLIIWGVLTLIGIVALVLLLNENHQRRQIRTSDWRESDYFVFAEKLNLVQKQSQENNDTITFTAIKELPFGTMVTINSRDREIHQNNKTYYQCTYYSFEHSDFGMPQRFNYSDNYYLEVEYSPMTPSDELLPASNYNDYNVDDYLSMFPIKEARQLPLSVKYAIVDYSKSNNLIGNDFNNYHFTQDANRIKKAIILADFNMDGEQDMAVVLENKDKDRNTYSFLSVLCYNKDSRKFYEAYTNSRSNFSLISPFKKDAKIFMNSENLINAPNNGFIYEILEENTKTKYAIFYNPETTFFERYLQEPINEN